MLFMVFTGIGLFLTRPFKNSDCNWQKLIGESFFIGIFVIVLINNILQFFNLNLSQIYFFYSSILFSAIIVILNLYQVFINPSEKIRTLNLKNFNRSHIFVLILIVVHLYFLIQQNKLLPLTPWDSWSAWVAKSKIWHVFGIDQVIVSLPKWFEIAGSMTNQTAHYPDGLSLLYLFNTGFFGWNESALNSIYPAMFIALLLMFYGNIKLLINEKYAQVCLVVLATLPFVNTHIVLAGYADIWIATFLVIVLFNLQLYILKKEKSSLLIACVFLLLMLMFKQEAIVWTIVLAVAAILSIMSHSRRRATYFTLFFMIIIWYFIDGINFDLSVGKFVLTPSLIVIPGLGEFSLTFVNSMPAWIEAMFYSKNWHLLWYFLPIMIYLSFKLRGNNLLILPSLFLFFAFLFLFVLFNMTYASKFAISFTSLNRIILHVVPVYIYFIAQLVFQYQIQVDEKGIT